MPRRPIGRFTGHGKRAPMGSVTQDWEFRKPVVFYDRVTLAGSASLTFTSTGITGDVLFDGNITLGVFGSSDEEGQIYTADPDDGHAYAQFGNVTDTRVQLTFYTQDALENDPAKIYLEKVGDVASFYVYGPEFESSAGNDGRGYFYFNSDEDNTRTRTRLYSTASGTWTAECAVYAIGDDDADVIMYAYGGTGKQATALLAATANTKSAWFNAVADDDAGDQYADVWVGASRVVRFEKPTATTNRWYFGAESNDYLTYDQTAESLEFYLDAGLEFYLDKTRFNVPNVYSDTTASTQNVHVDSNGRLRRSTSSLVYKPGWFHVNLADLEIPKPIKWFDKSNSRWRIGFGAEHIATAIPEAAEDENYDIRTLVAVMSEKIARLEKQVGLT